MPIAKALSTVRPMKKRTYCLETSPRMAHPSQTFWGSPPFAGMR